ncbi:hypothetical protein CRYUN_Cryun34aG0005200 [Craigia yunnanensis]
MEEASSNLIKPFSLLLASLRYSYFLLTKIPKGMLRFMFLLPIFYLFSILPWYFPSAFLRGITSFFITWIASSKLLLFCFNQGPLIQCQNFVDFTVISILPMRIKEKPASSSRSFGSKTLRSVMGRYETVQLFNKPYLATSLQEFWGRRWNRYASNILRETVHEPIRKMLTGFVGVGAARVMALICSLVVSGVLHEMLFYYITCGKRPTWEVTCYFVLQGMSMAFEALLKKWVPIKEGTTRTSLHPVVSTIWPCGFVVVTFFWLLVLPVWRDGQNSCDSWSS